MRQRTEKSLVHVLCKPTAVTGDPVSGSGGEEGQKRVKGVSPQVTERKWDKLLIRGRQCPLIIGGKGDNE